MNGIINLYSEHTNEIKKFLDKFFNENVTLENDLFWQKKFPNPIDMADMIGVFIDNNDDFKINMWISMDENFFINITSCNADKIIRYLFERYPY